jgi:hypothetical protein
MAVRTGLEPATPCVTGRYSNQLNYRTIDGQPCGYPYRSKLYMVTETAFLALLERTQALFASVAANVTGVLGTCNRFSSKNKKNLPFPHSIQVIVNFAPLI